MITRATFKCEQCGTETTSRIPTKEGNNHPKGWVSLATPAGFQLDWCSKECVKIWYKTHQIGTLVPANMDSSFEDVLERVKGRAGGRIAVPFSAFRSILDMQRQSLEESDETETEKELAEEFKIPREFVKEFAEKVRSIECPKCLAEPDERCHIMQGDKTRHCIVHGEELEIFAHHERVEKARVVWKAATTQ